jgi:hypothetical protein
MPDLVTLIAPIGTDEANHGITSYRVDNDRHVSVLPEAVGPLIRTGGFIMVKVDHTEPADESGFVRLMYPDARPGDQRTFNGHKPDKNAIISVPADEVAVACGNHLLVSEEEGLKAQSNLAAANDKLAAENEGLLKRAGDRDAAQALAARETDGLKDDLAARKEQLAARDARIAELEHQVAELEAHIAELTAPAVPPKGAAKAKA